MNTTNERILIIAALWQWIGQRPGLDFANYGDVKSYRAELRSITRDLHDARRLLRDVETTNISADALKDALRRSYSGRLSWDGKRLDYTTGQYWPTEYRRAACAVLASALWEHYREADDTGDSIRARFRRMYGQGMARRWFR